MRVFELRSLVQWSIPKKEKGVCSEFDNVQTAQTLLKTLKCFGFGGWPGEIFNREFWVQNGARVQSPYFGNVKVFD